MLFDGSNDYLRTTLGGTAFTGSFCFLVVGNITTITGYQHLLCCGDSGTNGHRRGVLKGGASGTFVPNSLTFNGQSADLGILSGGSAAATLATATNYILAVVHDGSRLCGYINGTLVWSGKPSSAALTAPGRISTGNSPTSP